MTKHITKKQVLLLMLIIFCILPFGCSGRHDNAAVGNPETEITAFTAVNGQTFYGVVDSYRASYPQNDTAECDDAEINNFFGIFVQEDEFEEVNSNTDPVKFRAFPEKKDASPLYKLDDPTCKTAEIGYAFFDDDNDDNDDDSEATEATTDLEIAHFLQTKKWESSLTQTRSQSITNLAEKILFSSPGSYYYIYPNNTEDSGITLNILSDSTLDITYTTKNVVKEDNDTYDELSYKDIKTVTKRINLKIETTDTSYYATLNEKGAPGSFPATVSVDLYKDEAQQEPLNYEMVLDYSDHKIRFQKTSSND
jgi:hypothetical protein